MQSPPTSSATARDALTETLELDLIGPWAGNVYASELLAVATWGDYEPLVQEEGGPERWQRRARSEELRVLPPVAGEKPASYEVPSSRGLRIVMAAREVGSSSNAAVLGLAARTRVPLCFVERPPISTAAHTGTFRHYRGSQSARNRRAASVRSDEVPSRSVSLAGAGAGGDAPAPAHREHGKTFPHRPRCGIRHASFTNLTCVS